MLITTKWIMSHTPSPKYSESRVHEIVGDGLDLRGLWDKRSMLDNLTDFLCVGLHSDMLGVTKLRWLLTGIAAHVLPVYETTHPEGLAPRTAIVVARQYLRGENKTTLAKVNIAADDAQIAAAHASNITAHHAAIAASYAAKAIADPTYARTISTYATNAAEAEQDWQCLWVLDYAEGDPEPFTLPPRERKKQ